MASRDILSQFQGLSLDNVGAWGPVPRMALWLLVLIACAVGGWFGLWSGQRDQLEQLQGEELKLKDEYKGKLQQAINLAKDLGYEKIRLDTLDTMKPAMAVYEKFGFKQTNAYRYNPYDNVRFYELTIKAP